MTKAFSQIEMAFAILLENGVYKQADLYESEGFIYAKAKGGYIRLMENSKTSHQKITWRSIEGVGFKKGNNLNWLKKN